MRNRVARFGGLRRRIAVLAVLFVLAAALRTSADENFKGMKVMPKAGAQVTDDDGIVDTSQPGFFLPWVVQDTKGDLLLVGTQHPGWVERSDVVTLEEAPIYYSEFVQRYGTEDWGFGMRGLARSLNGDVNGAITDYTQALRIKPGVDTLTSRGLAWDRKRQYSKAIADFTLAIRLNPKFALAHNNAAWLRATCPEARFRDARAAVELAQRACELTGHNDANYLDTLAAAYAEAGNFDAATEWAAKAVALSPSQEDLKQHLALFQRHEPFHER